MVGELPPQNQLPFFENHLERILDPKHDLVLLCKKIPWERIDNEFRGSYCSGRPKLNNKILKSCLFYQLNRN